MRTIAFRGKSAGIWVYGYYAPDENGASIIFDYLNTQHYYLVNPKTVGQYTGLEDKNGLKIYEGDCLGHKGNVVEWGNGGYCINGDRPLSWLNKEYEIVGNIHDTEHLEAE